MINRFQTSFVGDYAFKYELPESFFDQDILSYLDNKCCKEIDVIEDKILDSKKNLSLNTDNCYYLLREFFYKNYMLPKLEQELRSIRTKYEFKFGKKKTQNKIDIDAIKENVKCWDLLGKPEREDGNRLWYKLRNERTASCCVYKETNSFYDFGNPDNSGDVLNLYMLLNDCDFKTAIKQLSNNYD